MEQNELNKTYTKTELKERRIIDEWFLNYFNGLKAYQKENPNASDETAKVNFSKMLTKANVVEYIQEKQIKITEASEIKHEEIVRELKAFAFLDTTKIVSIENKKKEDLIEPGEQFEQKVVIKSFDELTDIQRRSIESIKETRNGIEVKFFPKSVAFEMLNKHIGFYEKDNSQKAEGGPPKKVTIEFKDFSEEKEETE